VYSRFHDLVYVNGSETRRNQIPGALWRLSGRLQLQRLLVAHMSVEKPNHKSVLSADESQSTLFTYWSVAK
jgi:hypothetical protein